RLAALYGRISARTTGRLTPRGPGVHARCMGTASSSRGPRDRARRALRVALALNLGFLGVETVFAFISGSLALLSDAAHMLSDVAALALALLAAEFALRPAVQGRTYGFA